MLALCIGQAAFAASLLNVSYDPTREFYRDYNQAFVDYYKKTHADTIAINMSHGGSGQQARAVIDGLEADVVTLALQSDIDAIAAQGLTDRNWRERLPNHSAPYTSTIIFLVRHGNPKNIRGWDDLVKSNVSVVVANPKTSGGARWAYLAAYGHALSSAHDDARAKDFVARLYANVPVLDAGARGATVTFARRGIGDVLLTWENEAQLARDEFGKDQLDIVYPADSILAEPVVAAVDAVTARHGTQKLAEAYLNYLYSETAQELAARHYYRPSDANVAKRHADAFPAIKLFTIDAVFGGWSAAQKRHFGDGGVFDEISARKKS